MIAGAVYAGKGVGGWTQDPAMTPIRNLYPVEFPSRLAAMENNIYASKEPWPLDFTREGLEADFLWLGDTATASRQAWAGFPGVYGYCPVRGPKPGATVFARFSDPRTAQGGQQPVYFAGQFYGSGSVFYLGSGEMWRLRAVDETYFEQFYTKLIRHVSQGRLLRGSSRGVLLVGQDRYMLGNTVEVRAQLTNARLDPLDVPSVNLQVIQPDGAAQTVALRADPSSGGRLPGTIPGPARGHLSPGTARAGKRRRTPHPPHPSEGARSGAGESPPERRPAQRHRQEHRRASTTSASPARSTPAVRTRWSSN